MFVATCSFFIGGIKWGLINFVAVVKNAFKNEKALDAATPSPSHKRTAAQRQNITIHPAHRMHSYPRLRNSASWPEARFAARKHYCVT